MQRLFTLALLLFTFSLAAAQELHTVYYANGKKAMEGKWTYTSNAYFSTDLLSKAGLRYADTNQPGQQKRRYARHYQIHESIFLNLYCDGPVSTWYQSGSKQCEITFKTGIAEGPYRYYYPDNRVAEEGTLKNGMPDGEWKQYNKDGSLNFSGGYRARSQDSLERKWNRIFLQLNPTPPDDKERYTGRTTITEDERERRVYASFLAEMSGFMQVMEDYTENESFRDGQFQLYYPDRSLFVKAQYRQDVRDRDWDWYNHPGHRAVTLSYKNGVVISVTDSNGRQQPIREAYVAYKERAEKRRTAIEENAVFKYVEQQPAFKGDVARYLSDHIKLPKGETSEGKAYVQIIVRRDGRVTNVEIIRSSGSAVLDAEALRVVKAMPDWNPGKNNGAAVTCYFTLPVLFSHE